MNAGKTGALAALAVYFVTGLTMQAGAAVVQTLDSVDVSSPTLDRPMRFDDARSIRLSTGDFETTPVIPGTAITSCQRGGSGDLVCADNDDIKRWRVTRDIAGNKVANVSTLFTCRDANLALDWRKSPACIAVGVGIAGDIWLAARKGNNNFSVLKVVAVAGNVTTATACATAAGAGFKPLAANATSTSDYCYREAATARPTIYDLVVVDGQVGTDFRGPSNVQGPGVLVMEDLVNVTFVKDATTPTVVPIAAGKTAWGLGNKENLQSAAVLQVQSDPRSNFVVATTNTGKVLARKADGTGSVWTAFDVPANRTDIPNISYAACNGDEPAQYEVRVNAQSGRAYVSDRDCHQVLSLAWYTGTPADAGTDPSYCTPGATSAMWLCNAREDIDGVANTDESLAINPANWVDVTLSTGTVAPLTLSVAPGIVVDMFDCRHVDSGPQPSCFFVADGGDANAYGASIADINLEPGSKTGLTVYRITGIPDCRYPPASSSLPCQVPGVIVPIGGKDYLNVSKLLPPEIVNLFGPGTVPSTLPDLLVSPIYRAKASTGRTFEAFFGRTEEGVQFRKNFDMLVDIGEVAAGGTLGCGNPAYVPPGTDWDLITTVSERYVTGSAAVAQTSPPLRNVDMLVNKDCFNPTSGAGTRFSLYPYNLELAVEQLSPLVWKGVTYGNNNGYDAYARLLNTLFDDLGSAIELTARVDVDGNGVAPVPDPAGASLKSVWDNARDKLNKCISAAYDKQSAANQTCTGFTSQFTTLESAVNALTPTSPTADKANRIGELRARVIVMKDLYVKRFLPSIPVDGFNNPP